MNELDLKILIERIIKNAKDAKKDVLKNKDDFSYGKILAYFEVLSTIKNELEENEIDIKKYKLTDENINEFIIK